ncbi:dTDP-4-dehydrorhamnose reductase [Pelagibius litoralis]|uniref:dTDP-4-dehydrorhamnose reductase n=1 Tax=Pelagibius litoralis TaxID=374515 RepID=A0A967C6K1_9PROT|nr:dTDP-4-dehydrorhamnose reductase [Pelagibius litoralis]NIA67512.1 dTDP-4-dehydrorhamnose reductase [Pelagibius litoralis]
MPEDKRQDKILLLGGGGQLGREIERLAKARGLPLTSVTREAVDITHRLAVRSVVDRGFSLVVNAAAYTAVDRAEMEEEGQALAVNRDGPGFIAEACRDAGAALVHLSTDYVFDGTKGAPYVETDPVTPLGVYGRSKAAGEVSVRQACDRHVILRTSWVFGAQGSNFVKTMLRLGRERRELSVVADQFGCPTPALSLASAVLAVGARLAEAPWGTYHCCGSERTTWYDFARAIFAEQKALTGEVGPLLKPIATEDYPTAARRPPDSTLDCLGFQARFHQSAIDWRQGLRDVLRELQGGERVSSAGRA